MRFSLRTISISVALLVAVGLITAAFMVSGSAHVANAENAEQLLRAYATKDSDSDGLPDWQEQLYHTDPADAHSVNASMTDGAAVEAGLVKPRFESEDIASSTVSIDSVPGVKAGPQTVTDKFSRLFFEQYLRMRASGATPTTDELLTFINDAVDELSSSNQIPVAYKTSDVVSGGSGEAALRAYAAGAERAFARDSAGPDHDPMSYFSDVVYKNDATALISLKQLAKEYDAIQKAFIKVPAPREIAATHLRLANALALMSTVVNDLTAVNDDPLRAFLVLDQYNRAAQDLAASILALHDGYEAAGVTFEPGEEGYVFSTLLAHTSATAELLKQNPTP